MAMFLLAASLPPSLHTCIIVDRPAALSALQWILFICVYVLVVSIPIFFFLFPVHFVCCWCSWLMPRQGSHRPIVKVLNTRESPYHRSYAIIWSVVHTHCVRHAPTRGRRKQRDPPLPFLGWLAGITSQRAIVAFRNLEIKWKKETRQSMSVCLCVRTHTYIDALLSVSGLGEWWGDRRLRHNNWQPLFCHGNECTNDQEALMKNETGNGVETLPCFQLGS